MEEAMVRQRNTEKEQEDKLPQRVPDFYRGLSVLVTGGSGFVGRVLVEKLLRSCPDIHTIFLLLRTRKGVPPNERIKKLTDVPLFDRLRAEQPDALAKVQVVAGDITQPGLGLSAEDVHLLRERVSVVFHSAASVRFNDPLEIAVRSNMKSTLELLELATQMPQMKAFVHVSTTYCNVGQKNNIYEEKVYPASINWRSLLTAVENFDSFHLRILTEKILGTHQNTYSFSKFLAEQIVSDYKDRLPVGIVRPSVVISTLDDPIPGWIDNYNGLMGLSVGVCKGIVHTAQLGPDKYINSIPCDTTVRGLIIISCDIARTGVGDMSVFHAAQLEKNPCTFGELIEYSHKLMDEFPFKETLYFPLCKITGNDIYFYILFITTHMLPAILFDTFSRATGRKPMLIRLQRRIYLACKAIAWFNTQNWRFLNKNFLRLEDKLVEGDRKEFALNAHLITPEKMFRLGFIGIRQYLHPESDADLPLARRRLKRKYIIHLVLKTVFYAAVLWAMLSILRRIFWRVL